MGVYFLQVHSCNSMAGASQVATKSLPGDLPSPSCLEAREEEQEEYGPVKNALKASKTHERLVPILVKHLRSGLVRAGLASAFSWVRKHQKSPSILPSSQNKGVCLLSDFIPGNPRAKHTIKLLLPPGAAAVHAPGAHALLQLCMKFAAL